MNQKQLRIELEKFIRAEYDEVEIVPDDATNDPDVLTEADVIKFVKDQIKMVFPYLVQLRKELNDKGPLTEEQYNTAYTLAMDKSMSDPIKGFETLIELETNPRYKAQFQKTIEFGRANLAAWHLSNDPTATEEQKVASEEQSIRLMDEMLAFSDEIQDSVKPKRRSKKE